MPDLAHLRDRIDAACARAASERHDAELLAEIENLLAEGYICALSGDRSRRRLQERFDALVEAGEGGADVEQLRAVSREQRLVAAATQELRAQLAVMREHWLAVGSERLRPA
jgi:DNA-binding FadR family transcriptional regulator